MRNSFLLFLSFFFYFTSITLATEKIVYLDLDYILSNSKKGKEILSDLDKKKYWKYKNIKIKRGITKKRRTGSV